MPSIAINQTAPDFSLEDFNGSLFQLSAQRGEHNILLVFNRGFT
jgi:peroxiredoxin